jgi:hypothetical protein
MSDTLRMLINASNLHVGGGVQVATSYLFELSRIENLAKKFSVIASIEVTESLMELNTRFDAFNEFQTINTYGLNVRSLLYLRGLINYDLVFTVFGPLYVLKPSFVSIVGFAQGWIIYPKNDSYSNLTFVRKLFSRLKYYVQGAFFRQSSLIVAELDHVRDGLVRELKISKDRVKIVRNCVSQVFHDPVNWRPVSIPDADGCLRIGFVGRNYSHKNTKIFPEVQRFLNEKYGIRSKFYVTFTDDEWICAGEGFRKCCFNVGVLSVPQCPSFYESMDAVIFPSMLECFSATPLEAMIMRKPLFASNMSFNYNICLDYAFYFDPHSAESAADAIGKYFNKSSSDSELLTGAYWHALNFSNPKDRALKYCDLMIDFCS